MIVVAHNEIVMLGRKLFEALGFAAGDYEDAAAMIAWCEVHGRPALAAIDRDLASFKRPYERRLDMRPGPSGRVEIDGRGWSCLLIGPPAADFGYEAALRDGVATVVLRNSRHPWALGAYLRRVARRGRQVEATWRANAGDAPTTAIWPPHSDYPTLNRARRSRFETWPTTDWLRLSYPQTPTVYADDAPRSSPVEMAARVAHHRDHGIEVDGAVWARLTAVAQGVLVAASDESRQRGAGE